MAFDDGGQHSDKYWALALPYLNFLFHRTQLGYPDKQELRLADTPPVQDQ